MVNSGAQSLSSFAYLIDKTTMPPIACMYF